MKYGHLERLRVTLTVQSPLFIGSGQKLQQKEILVDAQRHRALIPSPPDMIDAILNSWRQGISEDFIRFMRDSRQNDLYGFLTSRGMKLNPPPPWMKYAIEIQPDVRNINTLLTFTRDPEGRAYIPGSSIKGALRTALIAARMGDRDRAALCREMETEPRSRRASMAENVLRTLMHYQEPNNAVNDILRAIEISDSRPFPAGALTVCRRHWLSEDGAESAGRSPVYMECLRPGAGTAFYLTVDHALWPAGEDAPAMLFDALAEWDARIRRAYDARFARALADPGPAAGAPIVLGGGTGFQRKSLVYRAADSPEAAARLTCGVLRTQFNTTYKPGRARIHPYKYKAARYEGRDCPMGRCALKL